MLPIATCVDRDNADPSRPLSGEPPSDDPGRAEMIEGLKEQIRRGVYRPDVRDLARSLASMMVREL